MVKRLNYFAAEIVAADFEGNVGETFVKIWRREGGYVGGDLRNIQIEGFGPSQ